MDGMLRLLPDLKDDMGFRRRGGIRLGTAASSTEQAPKKRPPAVVRGHQRQSRAEAERGVVGRSEGLRRRPLANSSSVDLSSAGS